MSASMKQVAEVKLGGYCVSLDSEKLGLLYNFSRAESSEIRQIQEMTDWLLDLCCEVSPSEGDYLKYMKYLKNLRGAFEYLQGLDVTEEKGGGL